MARRNLLLWLTPFFLLQLPQVDFAVQRRLMSELHVGEKLSGVVSHITGSQHVLLDVGVEKVGLVPNSKMGSRQVAVGEEMEVWVSQVHNEENVRRSKLILSRDSQKVFSRCDPDTLQELHQCPETWLRGFVVAQRPWGLLVSVAPSDGRGARAVGVVRSRGKRSPAVGSEVKVRIMSLDLEKEKLVLTMEDAASKASMRMAEVMRPFRNSTVLRGRVLSRGKYGVFVALRPPGAAHDTVGLLRKQDSIPRPKQQELKLGQELEGVVVRTTSELTLVDLGYRQRGLLPPAKMGEAVHVGDRLKVWVSELGPGNLILASDPKKVLTAKRLGSIASLKDYKVNGWYQGIVLRLSPFGAFVAVRSGSKWAEGYLKTSQIQGELELGAEVRVRLLNKRLGEGDQERMSLSMRCIESSRASSRFATLQTLMHEIFPARVISVQDAGAEVELRHPETGSVMGWLPNEMQKGSKKLKPGEEMEVRIVDIDVENFAISLEMTQVPRGIQDEEFAALLADELGEDAIDMLREGDEVRVRTSVSQHGLELSLA